MKIGDSMLKMQEFSKAVLRSSKQKILPNFSLPVRKRSHNRESARQAFGRETISLLAVLSAESPSTYRSGAKSFRLPRTDVARWTIWPSLFPRSCHSVLLRRVFRCLYAPLFLLFLRAVGHLSGSTSYTHLISAAHGSTGSPQASCGIFYDNR